MELILLVIYAALLSLILAYSFAQLSLVLAYRRMLKNQDALTIITDLEHVWPMVTVQLPVYNERYVVERLIDAAARLDYPANKLEIHVLDDGDDESVQLAEQRIAFWREKGLNMVHVRRNNRTGYKAGALQKGLSLAKGTFIAIFDADFVPAPSFLKSVIPHFTNPKTGMVQARWGHLNRDYSLLTRLQAFGLDAHFTVEQGGRNHAGHFMNFNGTAGVWRRSCIEDAGGWQHDTITEDLDLSYRAQLNGWAFKYLEDVVAPAELPAEMNALKNQQFRWTKGAAECAVKHLPTVLRNRSLPWSTKVHAVFHLLNSGVFVVVLAAALLSVPVLIIRIADARYSLLFNLAAVFLLSLLILVGFYRVSSQRVGVSMWGFARDFPLFLALSMGMSLHNTIAVLEGYSGRKSAFVRTPKFAIEEGSAAWSTNVYRAKKVSSLTAVEALLGLYFLFGAALGVGCREFGLLPFHLLLSFGFLYVAVQSYRHKRA